MKNLGIALVLVSGLAFAGLVACDAGPEENLVCVEEGPLEETPDQRCREWAEIEIDRAKPRKTLTAPPCNGPARVGCNWKTVPPKKATKTNKPPIYKGRR